jgi:predicted  nucleic acid-binding Zn-ribbon protein
VPPVPEKDPIVSKSYAAYYVIAMLILMVTLFWALWDESFAQRPWKAFQHVWKDRYSAFLNSARSKSSQSVKEVEQESQYQQLEQAYKDANETARPRRDELQKQITDLSAKILAVQNVFTDRRAYVNALTYELETETSASGKKSRQQDIDEYKKKTATVEFPDGHKQQFNFSELEETYNSLKDQRTKLSAELGDVLKPVTEASNKMSSFVADHMVDLTPTQIDGLKKKTEEWDAKIV